MVSTRMSTVLGEDGSEEDALIVKFEWLNLAGLPLLLQNTYDFPLWGQTVRKGKFRYKVRINVARNLHREANKSETFKDIK